MNKKLFKLFSVFMVVCAVVCSLSAFADTEVMKETFEDSACTIKSAAGTNLSANIIDGDIGYGKVFQTSASSTDTWYVDLGKTFTKEDNNVAKISFDIKTPSPAAVVMFFLGDSEQNSTIAYSKVNTSYRKKLMYFRDTGAMGVFTDSSGSANWPTSGSTKTYTAGSWYHIDVIIDMYKQTATVKLDGNDWTTLSYSDSTFESFNFLGVKTEKKSGSIWCLDNLTVTDQTVEVDETVLFATDFEDVEKATSTGISFGRGEANSAVETGYGDTYNKVLRFDATASASSWVLVPVNASNVTDKKVSISFDMYAGTSDTHECMIQMSSGGTYYKALVMNGSKAAGKLGYYKFPDPSVKVWEPAGSQAIDEERWVHADGIIEFRDNQTILKWYFNGVYSGCTYSFDIKSIEHLRFRVEPVEDTTVTTRRFALDNILIRHYSNNEFTAKSELTGDGAGTTLAITPKSILSNNFSVQSCNFRVKDSQSGKAVAVTAKDYKDGKVILSLSGLEYNKPYTVTSSDFCDMYGQTMEEFEFYANPQYDAKNAIIPAVKAVWLYDYDGNRLAVNNATTEVNKIEILFNTRMNSSSMTGITIDGLTLSDESGYSAKNNSYTAVWDGYLEPKTAYNLVASGIKDVNGNTMADYSATISTGEGDIAVKSVEILNASGEPATAEDITDGAVVTAKIEVLNTSGEDDNAVSAYGIYKNSCMTDHDFMTTLIPNNKVTPIYMENIPYSDLDSKLKIFVWDKFSGLNPFYSGFDFSVNE